MLAELVEVPAGARTERGGGDLRRLRVGLDLGDIEAAAEHPGDERVLRVGARVKGHEHIIEVLLEVETQLLLQGPEGPVGPHLVAEGLVQDLPELGFVQLANAEMKEAADLVRGDAFRVDGLGGSEA